MRSSSILDCFFYNVLLRKNVDCCILKHEGMFMISLKAYNQEIEQLIDNGLYDDAIAHSIHILQTYPKCIDSYRNLGKSLLEQKKYPEALDVFSRVLSAIPDDFISHVGLSIIFEDQNNLDLAIWHMEQAFDVQPSNLAIQDELKRLFGLRDGDQPTKIRLTRGALVRMYARGELFQQAVTEILSILEEDPRRIDLEVILARMHYFSGAIEESKTDCNRILDKIPYCYEANRILQQIHLNNNDTEAASINKKRLIDLDPYYQFTTSPFSEQDISENKVLLEKLDFVPSTSVGSKIPEWLEDINLSSENKSTESFNWLSDQAKSEEIKPDVAGNPFSTNDKALDNSVVNNSIHSDDEIPDWVQTAGWNSTSGFSAIEEFEKTNINPFEDQPLTSESLPEVSSTIINSKVTNEDLASLFSELKEGIMDDENLAANGNEEKGFPPSDWMSQFSTSNSTASSDLSDHDFPDWLKNFQAEEPQISETPADMPDWLKNLQSETEEVTPSVDEIVSEPSTEEIIPNETAFENIFIQEEKSEVNAINKDMPQEISEQDDDWEKIDLAEPELDEKVIPSLATDELNPISSDDKIPDWVKSVLISQDSADQSSQHHENEPGQDNPAIAEEPSDILLTSQESNESISNSDEGIISQQTNDELLDWLRGLKTEEEPSSQTEEGLNPLENSSAIAADDELPMKDENQPVDDLHLVENANENVVDQNPVDQVDEEQLSSKSEMISELIEGNDTPLIEEVEYTEYANEMTETLPSDELSEKIQTSELHIETLSEISIDNFDEYLTNGDFDALAAAISNNVSQDQDVELLIAKITATESENGNNFVYWQCLGDIYSKNNQLNDALKSYQKAEDILVKTISS